MESPHYDPRVDLPPVLTSRRNPLVAEFRRAREGEDADRFLIEGVRVLEEAVKCAAAVDAVLVSERASADPRAAAVLAALRARGADARLATDEVLDAVSGARSPAGIAAIARKRECQLSDLFAKARGGFVVLAAGLADPGNLGTLLRSADGAGAGGFATTRDTVSPWNDKAARASAGSVLRIPIASGQPLAEILAAARKQHFRIVVSDSSAGSDYETADWRPPLLLVLGSEAVGPPKEALAAAAAVVRIPLRNGVESLNVAAAGSILCFAAARGPKSSGPKSSGTAGAGA
jgi:TrmH family RNA methyltransferase